MIDQPSGSSVNVQVLLLISASYSFFIAVFYHPESFLNYASWCVNGLSSLLIALVAYFTVDLKFFVFFRFVELVLQCGFFRE